ncbi:Acetyltransferase YpeA [Paenibacillus polymyxa]|uniref:GNAT family N-acetyltransferase n=1 Tax=Paenibacillus polymyxa TaxID=1406 RepID=UPI00094772F8|nr:GNAT family N-acetyltransferase [Paenibacillus polymyxa]APQ60469.1 GCN5 family acetyltransferase [Paenibacillus polymyxa]VUG05307.1 Acetyltransferase YpeA [Paenibacillus polymyxa]
MNPDLMVRRATITDAEELSRLNQEFNGGEKRPLAKIVERLSTNHDELIAVAETGGKIVGFGCAQSFYSFCYELPHGEITELFVEEAARRKGIAIAIISFLEEKLRERGVISMRVLTGRGNNVAIKTYEHCNYVKDDEQVLMKRLPD